MFFEDFRCRVAVQAGVEFLHTLAIEPFEIPRATPPPSGSLARFFFAQDPFTNPAEARAIVAARALQERRCHASRNHKTVRSPAGLPEMKNPGGFAVLYVRIVSRREDFGARNLFRFTLRHLNDSEMNWTPSVRTVKRTEVRAPFWLRRRRAVPLR
jgi:hypothetical protein